MNPITRKSMLKLVTQPSFSAVGQTHAEWQTFEKPENKRPMPDCHIFVSIFMYFSSSTQLYKCLTPSHCAVERNWHGVLLVEKWLQRGVVMEPLHEEPSESGHFK